MKLNFKLKKFNNINPFSNNALFMLKFIFHLANLIYFQYLKFKLQKVIIK